MAATTKSPEELAAAHKRTLEVFTGQHVTIILTDKAEEALKRASLTDILLSAEKYNNCSESILSNSKDRTLSKLKKIFCLLSNRAGNSARKIGKFFGHYDHITARYHINTGKALLDTDKDFKRLYTTIMHDVVSNRNTPNS